MKVEDIKFQSAQHVLDEIYNMNVKGGSPFGRAAAWAYKLACEQEALDSFDALEARMQELSDKLHKLKPTMATIRNSSVFARVAFDCAKKSGATLEETKAQIIATCDRIIESSYAAVDALAKNGANLITEGCTVMMHSYSSALMAVFTAAREQGKNFSLICTESRPLRESRLAVKVLRSTDKWYGVTYREDKPVVVEAIAKKIYRANGVNFSAAASKTLAELTELGYGDLPVCIAKTQYSFSDNAKLTGAPTGFTMEVREVRLAAGAGFVVVICGNIMTMPGLPKKPAAVNIDVDAEGKITGLF